MFGLYFFSTTVRQDIPVPPPNVPQEATFSGSHVSLLWGGWNVANDERGFGPHATPRVSVDYNVVERVAIGGSLGFYSSGARTEVPGRPIVENPTITTFVFAPRG